MNDCIVILIQPNCRARVLRLAEITIQQLQALVGGYVQQVPLYHDVSLIVNEDGIAMELPLNRMIRGGDINEVLFGTVAIVGVRDTDDGRDFVGLNPAYVGPLTAAVTPREFQISPDLLAQNSKNYRRRHN